MNYLILMILVTSTAITGDCLAYYIGNKFGYRFVERFGKYVNIKISQVKSLEGFLIRWGLIAVFLTRWLLTPLGIPVSLLSGITKFPFKRFILIAGLGELLWANIFIGLGFYFGPSWRNLLDYTDQLPQILLLTLLGIGMVYWGVHSFRQNRGNSRS
jgi:membrane protein DedA with SNARE-associated domain